MIELLTHHYTILLIRWFLALILLVAGVGKLLDRKKFVSTVATYEVLPFRFSHLYARGLPWVEFILGFCLLVGLFTHISAILTVLLLLSFIVAVTINLIRGKDLDCHCFGNLTQEKISIHVLLRNLFLLFLTLFIMWSYKGFFSLEAWLFDWPQQQILIVDELIPLILLGFLLCVTFLLVRQVFFSILPVGSKIRK
jgi:uncharacterized membrane protein YphA (DoxX/SURF4 family)